MADRRKAPHRRRDLTAVGWSFVALLTLGACASDGSPTTDPGRAATTTVDGTPPGQDWSCTATLSALGLTTSSSAADATAAIERALDAAPVRSERDYLDLLARAADGLNAGQDLGEVLSAIPCTDP